MELCYVQDRLSSDTLIGRLGLLPHFLFIPHLSMYIHYFPCINRLVLEVGTRYIVLK